MRLEINIADELPESKILSGTSDPDADVLDLVRRFGQVPEPSALPAFAAAVGKIRLSPNRFKTKEEIDKYVGELRPEWLAYFIISGPKSILSS
jgi:hypothetical protein